MSSVRWPEDILDRMVRAAERVQRRLHRTTAALEEAKIPYAVIDDHAVSAWIARVDESATRNTPDVDILLRRSDLPRAIFELSKAGFVFRHVKGIAMFFDGPDAKARDAVRVTFAGERVRSDDPLLAPEVSESEAFSRFRVVAFDSLIRMMLTSFRSKDRMNLHDLIDVGLLDETWLARLPDPLSERLEELLDNPEG